MTGAHDLGGLLGFGLLPGKDDELSFHAAWEARLFAIVRCLIYAGVFTFDELRYAVERMDPDDYVRAGYFERWTEAVERLCVEKSIIADYERRDIVAAAEAAE